MLKSLKSQYSKWQVFTHKPAALIKPLILHPHWDLKCYLPFSEDWEGFTDWMNFCTTSNNVLLLEHCTEKKPLQVIIKNKKKFHFHHKWEELSRYLCLAVVLLGEEGYDRGCNDVGRPVGGAARRLQQFGTGPHQFQIWLTEVMFAVWNNIANLTNKRTTD